MKRVTILAVLAMFALVGTAQAQQKGSIEIGTDAAFDYALTGKFMDFDVPDVIAFQLPMANWRFGFWLTETISLEPGIGFGYTKVSDDNGSTMEFSGQLSALYNMPSGLFFRVGGAIFYVNDDPGGGADSESVSIFGFGGGLGYRIDLVDMLKLRLGADYLYTLESEDDFVPAISHILVSIGFSFFTK